MPPQNLVSTDQLLMPGEEQINHSDKTAGKFKTLARVTWRDVKTTKGLGAIPLCAATAMTAYEWGPGNETFTPILGGRALDMTTGLRGILIPTVLTTSFTFGQQLLSGFLARKTVEKFPETAKAIFTFAGGDTSDRSFKGFDKLPRWKKVTNASAIGSSFNVLQDALLAGNTETLKPISRKSATMAAAAVAVITASTAIADEYVESPIADQAVEVIKNPALWLGLGAAILANNIYEPGRRVREHLNRSEDGSISAKDWIYEWGLTTMAERSNPEIPTIGNPRNPPDIISAH